MIRICCLFFFVVLHSVCLDAQFIELSNNNFYFQNNIFVPLVMNYAVNIRHEDRGRYWISRSMSYYTTPVGTNCRDEKECLEHLIHDFTLIKDQGFNVLRIVDFEFGIKNEELANGIPGTLDISYYYGPLKYHEFVEPFEDHFEVLDKLIQAAKQVNLKIILVSGGKQVDQFPLDEDYNIYLKYLSKRYKDESTIMAFDLLNEPSFFHKGHTKLEARMIVRKWTSTIREQTSHQLITIGLADSHTSFDWDPILLDVDFYS
ncbi:MAG: cellulase family glycosylhydrolase, partial [Saprospiraceae bacterium]